MNPGMLKVRQNYLYALAGKVSYAYGGDDIGFVRSHVQDVIKAFTDDKIEEVIAVYELMVEDLEKYPPGK